MIYSIVEKLKKAVSTNNFTERAVLERELHNLTKADEVYCIDATGDAVKGDEIIFVRAVWSDEEKIIIDYNIVIGKIVKESYGTGKGQHTFTILMDNGKKTLIKGRNLYRYGCFRKKWTDEILRKQVEDEKHLRGDKARATREKKEIGRKYGRMESIFRMESILEYVKEVRKNELSSRRYSSQKNISIAQRSKRDKKEHNSPRRNNGTYAYYRRCGNL